MKKILFAVTLFVAVAIFSHVIWHHIQKNEALRTGIEYFFDDIFTKHPESGLLIGSSSLRYIDQSKYIHCGTWLNRGIGDSDISTLRRYLFFSPLSISPKLIIVYAGENDIRRGASTEITIDSYIRLLSMLRNKYPESELHVVAIKPSPARKRYWDSFYRVNRNIEAHIRVTEKGFFHPGNWAETFYNSSLSFADDGIHLADEGYMDFIKEINELCK